MAGASRSQALRLGENTPATLRAYAFARTSIRRPQGPHPTRWRQREPHFSSSVLLTFL